MKYMKVEQRKAIQKAYKSNRAYIKKIGVHCLPTHNVCYMNVILHYEIMISSVDEQDHQIENIVNFLWMQQTVV